MINLNDFITYRRITQPFQVLLMRQFLFETGARPCEFLNLGKGNFNSDYSIVEFASSKSHVELVYNLSVPLSFWLKQFFKDYSSVRGWVTSTWSMQRDYDYYFANKYNLEAGHNGLYYLRYLCTARYLEEGKTIQEIADLFGHIDINNTLLYVDKAEYLLQQIQ